MYFIYCGLPPLTGCSSEALKEADSAKAHTLQQLKEENKTLNQELDSSHKGQSELSKVKSTPLVSHISLDIIQFLCVLLVSYKTVGLNSHPLSPSSKMSA